MTRLMTAEEPLPLALGDLVLLTDSYRMELTRPFDRTTLVDGTHAETALDVLPCTLCVDCRLLSSDAYDARYAVRNAIANNTAFTFVYDCMKFQNMTVREYAVKKDADARFVKVTLTLCGKLYGEEVPNA